MRTRYFRRGTPHKVCLLVLWCAANAIGDDIVLNVVKRGADPTGKRDSTEVLSQLHASGKRIYYPNGVYRFNGKTLDLSGGVTFESREGVIVRNDISPQNVLQFDDAGNLVGLQHNHLELDQTKLGGNRPIDVGTLVRPPVSTAEHRTRADLLVHWYNDFGLEHRRAHAPNWGWIGWYYWSWNFHNTTRGDYDPARHPLLGFYRGDDPAVLDWQCYWLREYGITGVILFMSSKWTNPKLGLIAGWGEPTHRDHWICRLFTDVPNFRGLKYVMTAPTPYSYSTPEVMAEVEARWLAIVEQIYLRYGNFYAIQRDGRSYPLFYLHEEAGLRGVFDNYRGAKGTLAFYRRIAAHLRSKGFGGVALLARHPISGKMADFTELEKDGVLHFNGYYATDHSSGSTYAERVTNYSPPVDSRTIINTFIAKHTHPPHPSKWHCPGHSPALFKKLLGKAVTHVHEHSLPRMITCYNMAEWAEGGPGLQPNVQDRFGYLEAVREVLVEERRGTRAQRDSQGFR